MVIHAQKTANKKAILKQDKKGVHLTGILAHRDQYINSLYLCGVQAAGRNFADLWQYREKDKLTPPLIMCDGLSANRPHDIEPNQYIFSNCLTHARRQFYNLKNAYPVLSQQVTTLIDEVYHYDHQSKEMNLTPQQRLTHHQQYSLPVMNQLRAVLLSYIDHKRYEPNSKPAKAIVYILKRWYELTVFLRIPGAPLDSNDVEQMLKIPIRTRKNAMFFKTVSSAKLSSAIMSTIMTAIKEHINPVDYLTDLIKHKEYVEANPEDWFPWEYQDTLKLLKEGEEDSSRQACAS
jgi:hypothetical protein